MVRTLSEGGVSAGRMAPVTGIGSAAPSRRTLFGETYSRITGEPVLMALHPEYYER
jgi:hypothetical protein